MLRSNFERVLSSFWCKGSGERGGEEDGRVGDIQEDIGSIFCKEPQRRFHGDRRQMFSRELEGSLGTGML